MSVIADAAGGSLRGSCVAPGDAGLALLGQRLPGSWLRVRRSCLSRPRSVFPTAFEDMLENPLNSTQWMNDPETGPVMLQISRIFQTLNRT